MAWGVTGDEIETGTRFFSALWSKNKRLRGQGLWVGGGGKEWAEEADGQNIITNNSNFSGAGRKGGKEKGQWVRLNDVRIEIVGGVNELNELKNNQRGAAALLNSIISSLDLWLLCTFYHLKKVIIMTKCRSPFQMKYLLISQQYSINLRQAA